MKLLSEEAKKQIPALYSQAGAGEPMAYIKLQATASAYTWFITEFNHEDNDTCFGYMFDHDEGEFGYFSLDALQTPGTATDNEKHFPLVTRDVSFMPKHLSVAIAEHSGTLDGSI